MTNITFKINFGIVYNRKYRFCLFNVINPEFSITKSFEKQGCRIGEISWLLVALMWAAERNYLTRWPCRYKRNTPTPFGHEIICMFGSNSSIYSDIAEK